MHTHLTIAVLRARNIIRCVVSRAKRLGLAVEAELDRAAQVLLKAGLDAVSAVRICTTFAREARSF